MATINLKLKWIEEQLDAHMFHCESSHYNLRNYYDCDLEFKIVYDLVVDSLSIYNKERRLLVKLTGNYLNEYTLSNALRDWTEK